MNPFPHFVRRVCAILLAVLAYGQASAAATYDPQDYARMLKHAQDKQYVRVSVVMAVNVPWSKWDDPEVKMALAAEEKALLAELGDTVLHCCIDYSPMGSISVYATAEALRRLASSAHVRQLSSIYGRDAEIYDPGSWLDDIESEIEQKGSADILAVLNLENFAFEFGKDGDATYLLSSELSSEIKAKLPGFLASLPPGGIVDLEGLKAELAVAAPEKPLVRMRVNKEGLYSLQKNRQLRSIRLASPKSSAPPFFAADVLDEARSKGFVDVEISLFRPLGFSILDSYLPAKAIQAQKTASQKAWDEIYSVIGAVDVVRKYEWGTYSASQLTLSGAEALYRVADRRIQLVRKPLVVTIDDPSWPLKQDGPLTARTVKMDVTPLQRDIGKTGGVYVAAVVPPERNGGGIFFLNADAVWMRFVTCEDAPAHYFGTLKKLENIPLIALPTDLSALLGTEIYAGWGVGDSVSAACHNMLNNGLYMKSGHLLL